MRLLPIVLLVGCSPRAAPVNIAENGSIGALPSASAAPASPDAGPEIVKVGANSELQLPGKVYYQVGKDVLLPESEPFLRLVVDFMRARPDVDLLRVEVHSDNLGATQYNMVLSEKRALATARWLIDHGVDCARLDAVGWGPTRPIVPNTTEEYRAMNRRTAFVVLERGTARTKQLCP